MNPESGIRSLRNGIWNPGSRMWNPSNGIWNPGLGGEIWNPRNESSELIPKQKWNVESSQWNKEFGESNLKCNEYNSKSREWNPECRKWFLKQKKWNLEPSSRLVDIKEVGFKIEEVKSSWRNKEFRESTISNMVTGIQAVESRTQGVDSKSKDVSEWIALHRLLPTLFFVS